MRPISLRLCVDCRVPYWRSLLPAAVAGPRRPLKCWAPGRRHGRRLRRRRRRCDGGLLESGRTRARRLLFQPGPRQQPGRGRTGRHRQAGGRQSAGIIALSTLPGGVSYYRLSASTLTPDGRRSATVTARAADDASCRRDARPVGHRAHRHRRDAQVGARATPPPAVVPTGDRDDLLDGAGDLPDASTNKFDMDIGVMASLGEVPRGRDGAQRHRAGFRDRDAAAC